MGRHVRRGLPDNLDPLVDTLANVVGILIIVIVLTQLELGDALARVAQLDGLRSDAENRVNTVLPEQSAALALRADQLRKRTDVSPDAAATLAEEALRALSKLTPAEAKSDASHELALDEVEAEVRTLRSLVSSRRAYQTSLARVPERLVARLPDPAIVRGQESWILVRHGRVYPVDRQRLLDEGSRAIERILRDGSGRRLRLDEFESAAHYLRKQVVGIGVFRWLLETEPEVRVQLAWRSPEGGVLGSALSTSPELRKWLSERNPERDFIRFHVWSDSFETYLEARQVIESAGFRAGWAAHPAEEELDLGLRFGAPLPRERAIEVD